MGNALRHPWRAGLGFLLAPEPVILFLLLALPLAWNTAYLEVDPLTYHLAYADAHVRQGYWSDIKARAWLADLGLTPEFNYWGYMLREVAPLLVFATGALGVQQVVRRRLGWKLNRWNAALNARNWEAEPERILATDELQRQFPREL
jgi:hypothetical protein